MKPPQHPADSSLGEAILALRKGGSLEEAFRTADRELRPRLLRYFLSHGFSRENSEDLVQTTLTRVFQGVRELRSEEAVLGWLFAIARNVYRTARQRELDEGRALGSIEATDELPDPRPVAAVAAVEQERLRALQEAIEELPPQQRHCLLLRIREEQSYDEIARTLRLSVNTVRNHLAQAKKGLRRALRADWAEGTRV
jgi:RNA polymerase sigma-70 factor (ECF subfamily)